MEVLYSPLTDQGISPDRAAQRSGGGAPNRAGAGKTFTSLIPITVAERIAGFRYDRRLEGAGTDPFEALEA